MFTMVLPIAVMYALYLIPLLCLTIFLYNRNHRPQRWSNSDSTNFDEMFLKYVATDGFWGGNQEFRIILSKILSAFRNKSCLGVIVCLEEPKSIKFQMIQFDSLSPSTHGGSKSQRYPVRFKGLPMIPVQKWGHATNRDIAMAFLGCRGKDTIIGDCSKKDENSSCNKVQLIVCSSEDIFRAFFEHLAATCRSRGDIDTTTGCKIYRGYLSPKKV